MKSVKPEWETHLHCTALLRLGAVCYPSLSSCTQSRAEKPQQSTPQGRREGAGRFLGVTKKQESSLSSHTFWYFFPKISTGPSEKTALFPRVHESGTASISCNLCRKCLCASWPLSQVRGLCPWLNTTLHTHKLEATE